MDPLVENVIIKDDVMNFTINNIHVSFINGLRRTIVADIPTIVFRTFPHDKNKASIEVNTTKFNNEIIKHRLSCIPIHINNPLDFNLKMYEVELHVKNGMSEVLVVTTNDFNIKDKINDVYLSKEEVSKIFPPDPITNDFIEFVRLMPISSDNLQGEEITLNVDFDLGTAKENSTWNVSSNCCFMNTIDVEKKDSEWEKKEKELSKTHSVEDIAYMKKDFMLLDAQRYFIENSFVFTLETLGIFSCLELVTMGLEILINKFKIFIDALAKDASIIQKKTTNIPFSYELEMIDEDYTFGKILEFMMYTNHFINDKNLTYISFKKPHPLNNNSFLMFSWSEDFPKEQMIKIITDECKKSIDILEKIKEEFKDK